MTIKELIEKLQIFNSDTDIDDITFEYKGQRHAVILVVQREEISGKPYILGKKLKPLPWRDDSLRVGSIQPNTPDFKLYDENDDEE